MRALSVRQPFAHAIVTGDKRVENRSRPTHYRGPLLIHAGISLAEFRGRRLESFGFLFPEARSLAFGAIVGVVELVDCVPLELAAGVPFATGPWCWMLADARPLKPVPYRGVLGFFEVPDRLVGRGGHPGRDRGRGSAGPLFDSSHRGGFDPARRRKCGAWS